MHCLESLYIDIKHLIIFILLIQFSRDLLGNSSFENISVPSFNSQNPCYFKVEFRGLLDFRKIIFIHKVNGVVDNRIKANSIGAEDNIYHKSNTGLNTYV